LHQQYINPSDAHDTIQRAIHTQLENAPLHLVNTYTRHLCDRQTQINAFSKSKEYKEVLSSSMVHAALQMGHIKAIVTKYFSWVMLSHRWENKELQLHDIQGKDVVTGVTGGMRVTSEMRSSGQEERGRGVPEVLEVFRGFVTHRHVAHQHT
jgi:hypothetical protein